MPIKSLGEAHTYTIERIRVDDLFGRYTYDLRVGGDTDTGSKLLILYGDNGSGKTTLLRLLFYLLAPVSGPGFKTFVAGTPFKRLVVDLGRNTQFVAERSKALVGPFQARLRKDGKLTAKLLFKTNKENSVTPEKLGYEESYKSFLKKMSELRMDLFYLTDDRELLTSLSVPKRRSEEAGVLRRDRPRRNLRPIDEALQHAIALANEWIKGRVLSGSQQGESDTTTIYTSIVRRLARPTTRTESIRTPQIGRLVTTLREQAERSGEFAKFGLPSALNINELITAVTRARRNAPAIYRVVEPFVDGIAAKLNALQEVQNSIAALVTTVNSFFRDKSISFDLQAGVTVAAQGGQQLSPTDLSSGEKQLLLLCCNTLVARERSSLFLIDEPELSLNIKWQRKLVDSLLGLAVNRNIQFMLATHSFELLAPHEQSVLELRSVEDLKPRGNSEKNPSGTRRDSQA